MKKQKRDTWKDLVIFLLECAILGAMFVYFTPVSSAESGYVFSENGETKSLKSLGVFVGTAYCKCRFCCGKYADGKTASGTIPKQGRTIAAPKNFPFGTKLVINGHEYTVEDRGGSIKGRRLDIYFDSHAEALRFGRQRVEVFCYE